MHKKRFTTLEIVVLFLILLCIGIGLIASQSPFGTASSTLEVTEFTFCVNPDENIETPTPIVKYSLSQDTETIFICGKAITDGRPASFIILVYKNKVQTDFNEYETPGDLYEYEVGDRVFTTPPGEKVENGFFKYSIPLGAFRDMGVYSAIIFHGRPLPVKARILITP